ncbi:MAG: glycosyltransferase family 4 protein, partial [Deltaproteobacteria bacterium]|nr:glycosyltransferase family 4 protein [Deltaproteobacteria bacterium]
DILGTIAAKLARIPVVVSSAEGVLFSRLTTTTAKMLVYRLGYRFVRNWIDAVIAISHFVGRELKDQFGVDPAKVRVVHLGLESSDFSTAINGKTDLKRDPPVIGAVSTLVEGKGLEYLLMAIPAIVTARPDTRLCIVGDGPLRGRLSELAVHLGVRAAVKFCGWVSPVKEVMEGFDVVVMPSLQEGLSWVVLEALALGKPVVATEVGGVPEIITHQVHGLLVPPQDPEALAAAVIRLLKNPETASALARAGQARVASAFTASREAGEIHGIYRSLVVEKAVLS